MKGNGNARASEALDALTARIIDAMEHDPEQWTKPWSAGALPANGVTGRRYNGTNLLLLSLVAGEHEYASNRWATFRQWKDAGCSVRKGERSSVVVFYKTLRVPDPDGLPTGDDGECERRIPMLRYSSVFAAEQVDGDHARRLEAPPGPGPDADERAEAFFASVGATVRYGGDSAHWTPGSDIITLPPRHTFANPVGYYSTVAHEHTHWTGHASRLDRTQGKRFGDSLYAREELVAELGAVFTLSHLGMDHEPAQSAAYLAHWTAQLKASPRDLWSVVGDASRAFEHLATLAEGETEAETEVAA